MWDIIITVVFKVVGYVLDQMKSSAELKAKWFEFVKLAGEDTGSTKLMQYGDAQLQWLKEHPFEETR